MRAITLLLICLALIATVNCSAFTAQGTVQVGSGTAWPATILYNSASQKIQITYSFGIIELESYPVQSRYQICPSACKNYFLSNPFPNFDARYNYAQDGSNNRYSYTSSDGYTTTIWVSRTTSQITKVKQEGNGYLRVYTFTSITNGAPTFRADPANCQAVQCGQALDLMLVIDSSGSISNTDYVTEMQYAQQVINSFTIGEFGVHAGLITFATDALLRYPITPNKAALTTAISQAQQQGGETNIGAAINLASQQFATNARGGAVPKVIILLTDGKANRPVSNPINYMISAANAAKSSGVLIYAIGVGPLVQQTDLNDIASSPTSEFTSLVSDFDALQSTISNILRQVCVGGETDGCNPQCYSDTQFCGCGQCQCVGSASLCGTRGTWDQANCECNCNAPWGETSTGHTCTRCTVTTCANGQLVNSPATNQCGCNCAGTNWEGPSCETCSFTCPIGSTLLNCDSRSCGCPGSLKTFDSGCTICDTTACLPNGAPDAETCTRCVCAPNWSGDFCRDCNWRCSHGGRHVNCNSCSCTDPWGGDHCDNCVIRCNNGGTVDSANGNCRCICPDNFSGTNCDNCDATYCKNGGVQKPKTDANPCTCTCPVGGVWGGEDCTTCLLTSCARGILKNTGGDCYCDCPDGYTGTRCDQCDTDYCTRGTQGAAPNSCHICTCPTNYGGLTCNDCLLDNAGNVPRCMSGTPIVPGCTSCNCPKLNGVAITQGTYCDTCNTGLCRNGGTIRAGSFPNCLCDCPPNFSGRVCENCVATLCSNDGVPANNLCTSCNCDTDQNWSGTFCTECNLVCSENGTLDTSTCTCDCDDYWTGNTCTDCHRDNPEVCYECSYNGVLNEDCTLCICDEYHTGEICDECAYDCGGNGYRTEDCRTCVCDDGWLASSNCTICDTSANSVYCNGLGTISDPVNCNVCTCVNQWLSGNDCSQCNYDCNGNGTPTGDCTGCDCRWQWDEETDCLECLIPCNNGVHNANCNGCNCAGGYITTGTGYCNVCDTNNYLPRCEHDTGALTADCECDCLDQWSGRFCDECDLSSCANGDVVDYEINGEQQCRCRCYNFWTGDQCDYCPFQDGPNPQYTCTGISVPVMTDCSCHCPEYYRDIEGCDECIITNDDCVHELPGSVPDLTKGVCKCICEGNWSGRNCSICDPETVICANGWRLDTDDCQCKEICGDELIVGEEECEIVRFPEEKDTICCSDCYFEVNLPCDDLRRCTRFDFCQVHDPAVGDQQDPVDPAIATIRCDGTDKMDYTVNADRQPIPLGPLTVDHWTKWGVTVTSSVPVSIVDTRTLGYPSTNPCGGDIVFDRVIVATNSEANARLCFNFADPSEVQSISVINNAKEPGASTSFRIDFYCTNTIGPITVDARNYGPGSVEFIRNPCSDFMVTQICYRNFPTGAIGPVFFCDDNNYNLGRLGDYVWYDINVDNIQDATELPVPNVPVKLYEGTSGRYLAITYTNDQGLYIFEYLYNGVYSVEFNVPSEYTYSTPVRYPYPNMPHFGTLDNHAITDTVKEILIVDVGIYLFGAIGDYVWYDYTEDGTQDETVSQYAISGVTLNLYESDNLNTPIRTTVTNANGNYIFAPLPVYKTEDTFHTYYVEFVPPDGTFVTSRFAGSRRDIDANFETSFPYRSDAVPLTLQKRFDLTIDAGVYYCCGSVGDRVWYDMQDTDGIQNGDESRDGVPGVRVTLYHNNAAIGSQFTDMNGNYLFTGLPLSGEYYVHFDVASITGYVLTTKSKGNDREIDSDANPNGETDVFYLTRERPDRRDIDAGIYSGCTVASECTTDDKCKTAVCVNNKCVFTDSVTCSPLSDPCVEPVCQPSTGNCVPVPKITTETIRCNDENECTYEDICINGVCTGTSGNGPAYTCDDNNICTTPDVCVEGTCTGTPCTENPDPCITTVCDPVRGCKDVPSPGTVCDDGNRCTESDVCDANGRCNGTPRTCPNNEYCKVYECDAGTGQCKSRATPGETCSDNNSCTTGDVCDPNGNCNGTPIPCTGTNPCLNYFCSGGECRTSPKPSTTTCTDNDSCTENDRCQPDGTCAGTPKDCDDGKVCTTDTCDRATGTCGHVVPTGATCTDNIACTNDVCSPTGACISTPINCDDRIACTVDECVAGVCEHRPTSGLCNDNDKCTIYDACDANNVCRGVPKPCDDGNICTNDYCDGETGRCVHENNDLPCQDNNECTRNSYCTEGECVGYDLITCSTNNPCALIECDTTTGGCIESSKPDDTVCTTNDLCRLNGVCQQGECQGRETVCNDNNPCTVDTCNSLTGGCLYTHTSATDNIPCDDGNKCTERDVCLYDAAFQLSRCNGIEIVCNDDNICTRDLCYASDGRCHYEPTDSTVRCNDNDNCTEDDVCVEGECAGTPRLCTTTETCKESVCDAVTGQCVESVTENAPCNDGNVCTEDDTCDATGTCTGTNPCAGLTLENPCKEYQCSDTGDCIIVDKERNTPCDDGRVCTEDDVCIAGQCTGTPYTCTSDVCNRRECFDDNGTPSCRTTFTQNTCGPTSGCRDSICSEGTCTSVINTNCNAGNTNTCVRKYCAIDGRCLEEDVTGPCEDGDACTVNACEDGECVVTETIVPCGDTQCTIDIPCPEPTDNCFHHECINNRCILTPDTCTQSTNQCIRVECNPLTNQCTPIKLENTRCDDNNKCTGIDICVSTGNGPEDIECRGSDVVCPDRLCERGTCNPDNGQCRYSVTTDAPCDDGLPCTENDVCDPQANCNGTPKPCDDGNTCTDDVCDIRGNCVHTNNNRVCTDGNLCTSDDRCVEGVCIGSSETSCPESTDPCKVNVCDPIRGCVSAPVEDNVVCGENTNGCLDGDSVCRGGVCVPPSAITCPDSPNPQCPFICVDNECKVDPDTVCDDGDDCTVQDRCRPNGQCTGAALPCDHLNNGCAVGECYEGACVARPITGTTVCDDGDACTINYCEAGLCLSRPRTCPASTNPCEVFTCDPEQGCVGSNNPISCTPSGIVNLCFDHICIDRICTDVSPVKNCDDQNPCTLDQCLPETGECRITNNQDICDDNDACTDNICIAGECVSTPRTCDDENICTTDRCESGICINEPNELSCPYTDGCITGGKCSNKVCTPNAFSDCSSTPREQCQSVECDGTTGACILSDVTDGRTDCDDGDDCTDDDVCTPNGCIGTPRVCPASLVECKESQCVDGECVFVNNNNLVCHSRDTSCRGSLCVNGECVANIENEVDCSDDDLCTFNNECTGTGCAWDEYSCILSPCAYSRCNDDGWCVFDRNVPTWDPLTYISYKTFNNSATEGSGINHYLIAISAETGNLRGFVRLSNPIITLSVLPYEGGLYAGSALENDLTNLNVYRIPVNASAVNVFADGVIAGWRLITSIPKEDVDFTFKPNFVAANQPHIYDLWARSRTNGKIFDVDVTTTPAGTTETPYSGLTQSWSGIAWDNHGRWFYGADGETLKVFLPEKYPAFAADPNGFADSPIGDLCLNENGDLDSVIPPGRFIDMFTRYDETLVGATDYDNGEEHKLNVFRIQFGVDTDGNAKCFTTINSIDKSSFVDGRGEDVILVQAIAFDDTICLTAAGGPASNGGNITNTGGGQIPGHISNTGGGSSPPPINPPGSVISHQGGAVPASHVPGTTDNNVLTGGTGAIATGVVSAIGTTAVAAFAIFAVVLGLNNTKKDPPANLTAALVSTETTAIASDNPLFQGMNEAGTNILA